MSSGERLGKWVAGSPNGAASAASPNEFDSRSEDHRSEMRIDMHLHSRASGTATY
jgi:hypothetical protein